MFEALKIINFCFLTKWSCLSRPSFEKRAWSDLEIAWFSIHTWSGRLEMFFVDSCTFIAIIWVVKFFKYYLLTKNSQFDHDFQCWRGQLWNLDVLTETQGAQERKLFLFTHLISWQIFGGVKTWNYCCLTTMTCLSRQSFEKWLQPFLKFACFDRDAICAKKKMVLINVNLSLKLFEGSKIRKSYILAKAIHLSWQSLRK